MRRRKKTVWDLASWVALGAGAAGVLLPMGMVISGALMGREEIWECMEQGIFHLLPRYPTLRAWVELLCDTPEFFVFFWNSVRQAAGVLAGQALFAVPSAWVFARFSFRGKRLLFRIYVLLMILPFQVTMVSGYIVLDRLGLMDGYWAVVLPMVFSTFSVFVLRRFFEHVPEECIEAAKLDGAGDFRVFWHIGVPLCRGGIAAALLLAFFEYWNAVEAPMVFLTDASKFPLSLYLPEVTGRNADTAFAASLMIMLPALLVFWRGEEAFELCGKEVVRKSEGGG